MSKLQIKSLAFTALAVLAVSTPAAAQSIDDVRSAIVRADLKSAVNAARTLAESNPSDAVAQQVYGILEMANGDPKGAEKAFTAAIEQGDAMDPTETGLEKLDYDASILHIALNRQKVSVALGAGGAAAYNNRAAARIVMGHIEDAFSDLDDAMRRQPHWGTPSANAAVAWLESNSPRKAKRYVNQALSFNEATAKVYTSLAEAQMRQNDWKAAGESFRDAEDKDRNYPYELYERARWFHEQGQTRDEQRAMFQAIALDPAIADEDRYSPRNIYSAGGGNQQTDREHLFNLGRAVSTAFQSSIERDRGRIEDRSDAYQRRDFSQTILGSARGQNRSALFLNFLNENGGRPGGIDQFTIPNATFGFRRSNVSLFQEFALRNGAQFMLETTYRRNKIDERSSDTAPDFQPLSDYQYGLEGRYDTPVRHKDRMFIGYAWMQNSRRLENPPAGDPLSGTSFTSPLEPNEQLLPGGKTSMQTLYVITQHPLSPTVNMAYGPIAAARGNALFALPYLDIHWTKSPRVTYRFAALPRLMNANSDLLPIWSLSSPIVDVPTNKIEQTTNDYNQNPFIPGPDGRLISVEISQSQLLRTYTWLNTTIFHREFHDYNVLSQDPTVSPVLLLTHVPFGSTTGVSIGYDQPIFGGITLQLGGTLQTSRGTLPLSGAPTLGSLPYVPKMSGIVGLGWGTGSWGVVVHTIEVGTRKSVEQGPLPIGIGNICGNCSYQIATVSPQTLMDVTVTDHLPNGQDLVFVIQPVNTSGYYFNYPKKPFISVGYNYRY
jgi:tetratricopeptide (TPR) repeat protein